MELLKAILNWQNRKLDLRKIKVTSGGGFYLRSEDLFNDRNKSLAFLAKLEKSIKVKNS